LKNLPQNIAPIFELPLPSAGNLLNGKKSLNEVYGNLRLYLFEKL
jgi:hypothetical protein